MKYTKTRTVKSPNRGTSKSAGIDFFVPIFDKKLVEDLTTKNQTQIDDANILVHADSIDVAPGGRVLIPAGIHTNLDSVNGALLDIENGIMLEVKNKSGVASKKGLDVMACIIDQDYQGEIHISLVNTGTKNINIAEGDKLVQMILIPVIYSTPEEVGSLDELFNSETERGNGGFGSTGVK